VDVTFAPLSPGARNGAVELVDGAGDLITTTYIYGTGVGPQAAFGPPTLPTLVPQVADSIYGLAADGSGNLFVQSVDDGTLFSRVQEFLAEDSYTTSKTILSQVQYYDGIALDGAGNIFTCGDSGTILELVAAQGYAQKTINDEATQGIFGSVVVDGSGNLFVPVGYSTAGVRELLEASNYQTAVVIGGGFHYVSSLALDAAGNVFVSDVDQDAGVTTIKEVPKVGGYTAVKNLFSGSKVVDIIGVDAADNVYLSGPPYPARPGIYEAFAVGGYTTVKPVFADSSPFFLEVSTLDSSGDIYAVGWTSTTDIYSLHKLIRSQGPDFSFGYIRVGNTSVSQSTTLQNIGNKTLTGSLSLTDSSDFALIAGSGSPADCADDLSLVPGAECSLNVTFVPKSAGLLTGSVALDDNAVNQPQSLTLSGTGVTAKVEVSPATLKFGSLPLGDSASQTLTISNVGSGNLTIDPSSDGPSTVIAGNTCGTGIGAGKTCALEVKFKPARLGSETDTVTIGTNTGVNPGVPTQGAATGVGSLSSVLDFGTVYLRSDTETLTVTNFGVSGSVTVATSTGAVSFTVTSNGCTSGITSGNSCQIEVEYEPTEAGTQTAYLKLIPSTGPAQYIRMIGTYSP
jgi:hypothetical protein